MIRQLLEVGLLLVELLPQLEEPLLLALADGVVLAGLFAALEGVSVFCERWSARHRSSHPAATVSTGIWPSDEAKGEGDVPLATHLGRSARLAGH